MPNPYSSATISGYNSSPPSDDGTEAAQNEITWAKHKTKLADPIKTLAETIDSNVASAFGKIFGNNLSSISADYTVVSGDQGKLIAASGTITITLPAAATIATPFCIAVKNVGSGTVTLDGDGTETIDGDTTVDLDVGQWAVLITDGSGWRTIRADANATAWQTGDVKTTYASIAPTGWIFMDDGTIGDASSSASNRANADTEDLFTLLWINTADADCAVSSGRGASASADFSAHKTIALPKVLGRVLGITGAGSGLTTRALAVAVGAETHSITAAELPSAVLGNTGSGNSLSAGSGQGPIGSGTAMSLMQPSTFLKVMIKL